MAKKIEIKINNKKILAEEGQTILEVAEANGVYIPTLCSHPDLEPKPNCRLCLVGIKDKKGLHTSCSTYVAPDMEIITESEEITKARQVNLELIFAQHREECSDCVYMYKCQIKDLAKKFHSSITRFPDRKNKFPTYEFGSALQFDSSKCIDCGNCVEICHKQGVDFLTYEEDNTFFNVVPTKDKDIDCIYCGQCLVHCPVGAFEGIGEFEGVEKPLVDKNKTVVFQFAPSVRVSIGEEFGLEPGVIVTEQLSAGLKMLGADYVFDVAVGSDVTTIEEAKEFIERVGDKKSVLPMFTSCCPSWVKYVEFFYPEYIPNLTTVRSPQINLGGLIKTYWAKSKKIDPKNIIVVSVMPCVSKKSEMNRPELKIDGLKPVDYVLTTRELAYLFKKHKIDLPKLKPKPLDDPLGRPTGSGVIYGAVGGVMESALRTVYFQLTGKNLPNICWQNSSEIPGLREATIKIKGQEYKVAYVSGSGSAEKLLHKMKANKLHYDYVEVMACPGGCIGGGGQPVPTNQKIREKRAKSLFNIDIASKLKAAQDSPEVQQLYKDFFVDKKIIHKICHTHFNKTKKQVKV
ncbi:MAG: NADP-reducing hydrogenase subunit HndD [Patescibacteria group bacterium]|nr:NADP-reducing hydrogenase subunit HndD [Patescibacteria group bacterium]